jgi:hypothetical protein
VSTLKLCGSHCEHAHDSINGPTGCCPKGHGPYLYYCNECHKEWERENPERVKVIEKLCRAATSPEAAKGGGE